MARVKVKKVKSNIDTSNVNSLFEEMLGVKNAKSEIIIPKFVKIMNTIRYIHNILKVLSEFKGLQEDFPPLVKSMDEIKTYIHNMQVSVMFDLSREETEDKYTHLSEDEINKLYKKLKENTFVRQLILLCSRLKQYKFYLEDPKNLKDNFIGQEPGLSFKIFDFSNFDLKYIWCNPKVTPIIKTYILNILHKIYNSTYELYETITSPDVNIDEVINVLLSSIDELNTTPGLNRCTHAFKKIRDSVYLLKNNFPKYYRESVSCGNPDLIVQNFIIDVSNDGAPNAKLTSEFRKIILYIQKIGNENGRGKDPTVKKLFQMLNKNFEIMEKNTPAAEADSVDDLEGFDLSSKSTDKVECKTKNKSKDKKNAKVKCNKVDCDVKVKCDKVDCNIKVSEEDKQLSTDLNEKLNLHLKNTIKSSNTDILNFNRENSDNVDYQAIQLKQLDQLNQLENGVLNNFGVELLQLAKISYDSINVQNDQNTQEESDVDQEE
jgi:hypothetical protein